ncbi:het domain-containing protein [Colletotrichum karsti]|uniref:Het domain-containing protein n=1 Tax=Colletotrichum karsti TaxID=1095194 RepID=A0A9P6HZX9_9PEZI|nr:het domain-containing protein [Colletotrichum karsti]KAF9874703.1 het domain-containing protein [Colletotrichum karsti]
MKLINVHSLAIESFGASETIPRYAILSHTWGNDEISLQEWTANYNDPSPEYLEKPGYSKIVHACSKTRDDRLGYLWVDTVCIDKTSSAELSEAINSMFAWYERAAVCLVYLADVEWADDLVHKIYSKQDSSFGSSRWFSRGWTLQELLAPEKVFFFTKEWIEIGTKSELMFHISKITGIDVTYLTSTRRIWSASVSARMSWASKRQTTRPEDIAYCLLGIFDINMPLLYGEGSRAFLRLQEEIIKSSDDHTIFCWAWVPHKTPNQWQSVLAPSPAVFANSSSFVATHRNVDSSPYQITNIGLRIRLPVVAAVNCLCAMLSVISTDEGNLEHKRMMCLPLMEEGIIHRRCPFPMQPFPVHRSLACDTKEMHLLYKISRNTEDLMPWPYRHQFEYGFYINILDESFSTDMNHQMIRSIDCLVPQYKQTPTSHTSRPVYSAVGFRSTLKHDFGGLILRLNHQDDRFLVLLSVSKRGNKHQWSCEIVDPKYDEYNATQWLREFEGPLNSVEASPDCTFHTAISQSQRSKILVALDGDIRDETGRRLRVVYIVISKTEGSGNRMQDVWTKLQQSFDGSSGRRLLS